MICYHPIHWFCSNIVSTSIFRKYQLPISKVTFYKRYKSATYFKMLTLCWCWHIYYIFQDVDTLWMLTHLLHIPRCWHYVELLTLTHLLHIPRCWHYVELLTLTHLLHIPRCWHYVELLTLTHLNIFQDVDTMLMFTHLLHIPRCWHYVDIDTSATYSKMLTHLLHIPKCLHFAIIVFCLNSFYLTLFYILSLFQLHRQRRMHDIIRWQFGLCEYPVNFLRRRKSQVSHARSLDDVQTLKNIISLLLSFHYCDNNME